MAINYFIQCRELYSNVQALYRSMATVLQGVLSVESEPFRLSNEVGDVIFKKVDTKSELGLVRSSTSNSSILLPKVEGNAADVVIHVSSSS